MSKFKEGMPITVNFNKSIRTDGNITIVRIVQGENEVQLTQEQIAPLVAKLKPYAEAKA